MSAEDDSPKRPERTTTTRSMRVRDLSFALTFAAFLLAGAGLFAVIMTRWCLPEWRVNRAYRPTTCVVLGTRISQSGSVGDLQYRPDVHITYQADDRECDTWTYDVHRFFLAGPEGNAASQDIVAQYEVGRSYPAWYDPDDPEQAVLVRGYTWYHWLLILIPVSFVSIGGGGLGYTVINWGKSAERRAVILSRAPARELFENSDPKYPRIPRGANLTNSPGTRLTYRLPVVDLGTRRIFLSLGVALAVNAAVIVFTVMAIRNHLRGEPDWFLNLFLLPWIAIGVGALIYAFRQLLVSTGVGPTALEISEHPLRPGESVRIHLSQSGRLTINHLRVDVVCEERATFQQGTNTRTETCRVVQSEVYLRRDFEIRPGVPFEDEFELSLPNDAMHSFKSPHNEINWRLMVEGSAVGWPPYQRSFPVVVYPPNHTPTRK